MDQSTIQTFRGANAREALAAAKAALGPDAIVLHAREVPGRLFHKPQFEVMAALDDKTLQKAAEAAEAGRHRAALAGQKARDGRNDRDALGLYETRQDREQREDREQRDDRSARDERPARSEPAWQVAARTEEPQVNLAPQHAPPAAQDFAPDLHQLRSALEEARGLIGSLSGRGASPLAAAADEVHGCLVARGMEDGQASRLIKEALAQGTPLKPLALFGALRDLLQGALVADRAPWAKQGKRALALIGPTGVGKTTTLAKIAAKALMEHGRKVGLITVDTYRIGASEQLARYGEIMGIPAFVCRGRPELTAALERLAQCDLVLVDTAGRSQNDQVVRQAELVRTVPGLELHLVVSAATGARDLAAVATRYAPLRPERLILSKLDEAAAPAGFLSANSALAIPVSCVCDGQRVPEDIHAVTRTDLVDLVLGSWDHGRV